MNQFFDKLVRALGRSLGAALGVTIAFGFLNYIGWYAPWYGEPASLPLVAWAALIASWRWPKDIELEKIDG